MPKERHIRIRAQRRAEPDLKKLSKALIALAMAEAQAEKEAAAEYDDKGKPPSGRSA